MIKIAFVEAQEVGIPPEMFRMALPALLVADVRVLAMKPLLPADVVGYFLMAVETQAALRCLVERLVAIGTLRFDIRVCVRHGSGHHQGLEVLGLCNLT
jgi:hypothetical protein